MTYVIYQHYYSIQFLNCVFCWKQTKKKKKKKKKKNKKQKKKKNKKKKTLNIDRQMVQMVRDDLIDQ